MWEFPGGKVEDDEIPQAALVREIQEELGISITVGTLVDRAITEVDGLEIDLACYHVSSTEVPATSTDHDELCWVSREEPDTLEWATPDLPAVTKLANSSSLRM